MTSEFKLPPDTRPLNNDDLVNEDFCLLADVETAMRAVLDDCSIQDTAKSGKASSEDPWARLDRLRTPRVMMIDGERGTGKTSLMLTLLRGWEDGKDGKGQVVDKDTNWPNPDLAPRVRALHPLDFDPLPPGLPLLAWIVQAFKPVVDWAVGRYVQPGAKGLSLLDERPQSGENNLASRWQRIHDDAAVAWQPPESPEPYERGEDHLRRVRKWSQFEREWGQFLDALVERLTLARAWGGGTDPGILVLPIDDLDMQIGRAPELVRALRLLHHPRLVFLLTGHGELLDHVLQLDFDGQRARLVHPLSVGRDRDHNAAKDLGVRLAEKVVREPLRFPLPRLDLSRALQWRRQALIEATGTKEAKELADHILKQPERWTGLLSITYRQITDLEHELRRRKANEPGQSLVLELFRFANSSVLGSEPQDLRDAAKTGGLLELLRRFADDLGRVRLVARSAWQPLIVDTKSPSNPKIEIAKNQIQTRPNVAEAKPLDRWIELWGRFGQGAGTTTELRVSWGGLADGAVIATFSARGDRRLAWPSPWFADWAGASESQTKHWQQEYEDVRKSVIQNEMEQVRPDWAAARTDHELLPLWEALLCGWVRHLQESGAKARKPTASPRKGKIEVEPPMANLPTASGKGDRLCAILERSLVRRDKAAKKDIDGAPSALALAHPAFEIPAPLQHILIDALWPIWPSPESDPRNTNDDGEWDRRWRAPTIHGVNSEKTVELLGHLGLIDWPMAQAAEAHGIDSINSALLASLPEPLQKRSLLQTPWGGTIRPRRDRPRGMVCAGPGRRGIHATHVGPTTRIPVQCSRGSTPREDATPSHLTGPPDWFVDLDASRLCG